MPYIDAKSGEIVIRIVYDGAPMAGKTTNVERLCSQISLQRRGVLARPGQIGQRTEYFDWLDFTGGYLDGRRVRCQLISVPGQPSLLHRRRYLLKTADAIVFVADSRPSTFRFSTDSFATTVRIMERLSKGGVPIGVVLQANKQDMEDAVPPAEVARAMGANATTPVLGATAETGQGIMQTFLLGVRLATDRVRALMLNDEFSESSTGTASADELHAALIEEDAAARKEEKPQSRQERIDEDHTDAIFQEIMRLGANSQPESSAVTIAAEENKIEDKQVGEELPEPQLSGSAEILQRKNELTDRNTFSLPQPQNIISGHIWPPVKGRLTLAVATSEQLVAPEAVLPWAPLDSLELLGGSGWVLHSTSRWVFESETEARSNLLALVRRLLPNSETFVDGRGALLAGERERWRLWLLTPRIPSVQESVIAAIQEKNIALLGTIVKQAATQLEKLTAQGALNREIPAGAGGIAMHQGRLVVLSVDEGDASITVKAENPNAELSALIEGMLGGNTELQAWFSNQGRELLKRELPLSPAGRV